MYGARFAPLFVRLLGSYRVAPCPRARVARSLLRMHASCQRVRVVAFPRVRSARALPVGTPSGIPTRLIIPHSMPTCKPARSSSCQIACQGPFTGHTGGREATVMRRKDRVFCPCRWCIPPSSGLPSAARSVAAQQLSPWHGACTGPDRPPEPSGTERGPESIARSPKDPQGPVGRQREALDRIEVQAARRVRLAGPMSAGQRHPRAQRDSTGRAEARGNGQDERHRDSRAANKARPR